MSLADRIPSIQRSLDAQRVFNILWLAGAAFTAGVILMLLLQRLGVPMPLLLVATAIWIFISTFVLSWMGRTMTSAPYFFAGRIAGSAPLGLGGLTDWIGGSFLVLFFSASLTGKMILAPSLMLGLLLQATLFAVAFQRTGVATLPGFFAWRSRSQLAGGAVLVVVIIILSLLIVAEFSIAQNMFAKIALVEPNSAAWFVVILAVIPTLMGGWLSLVILNGVISVWLLICVLSPAIITGFFPNLLRAGLERDYNGQSIAPLQSIGEQFLLPSGANSNTVMMLVSVMVLSAGFSVIPHALSRVALNKRHIAAIESLGWSALGAFLILSALPLSIGLIGINPSSSTLALLLKSQPVLYMLPNLALFFAAYNALCVTVFALSSAIVRTMRRSRNLDPGEQSMFSTRLLAVLVCISLVYIPWKLIPSSNSLLAMALSIGAGSIFIPLVASIWLSSIPRLALILSVLIGAIVVCFGITSGIFGILLSGALGMVASGSAIIIGRMIFLIRKPGLPDPRLLELRQPDSYH